MWYHRIQTKIAGAAYFYRPQTKVAKVTVSQVSVCPPGGGRGCGVSCPRGVSATPPPPWADTTPWADTPLPSACCDTPPSASWDTHPLQCMRRYTPPAQCMLGYGQQAGCTHPTGMYSSCLLLSVEMKCVACLTGGVIEGILYKNNR